MRRRLLLLGLPVCLVAVYLVWSGESSCTMERDIVYGRGGSEKLALDLAVPKKEGRHPVIVCLHGGGWRSGSRQDLTRAIEFIAARGFAAATVSYRLAPRFQFPAQIEDCKTAIRWLRANADKYRFDASRIGVVGYSAGAHLACLLGTADKEHGLEGNGGHENHSSRVQAVVSFFGPTDMIDVRWPKVVEDTFLIPFLGGRPSEVPEKYRQCSPIIYASRDDPPFLFFHGTEDKLVGIENSQRLAKKLQDAGAYAKLVTMEGDGHGWGGFKLQQTIDQTVAFFEDKLKFAGVSPR